MFITRSGETKEYRFTFRGDDRAPNDPSLKDQMAPWKINSIEEARAALTTLVAEGTLSSEAQKWCLEKDRKNGWFISTGVDNTTAYDTYPYYYAIAVGSLQRRKWSVAGKPDVKQMTLYTDAGTIEKSTLIAVIWFAHPLEPLIMTPIPRKKLQLKKGNRWSFLT